MPRMSRASTKAPAARICRTASMLTLSTARCSAVTCPNCTGPFLTVPAESTDTAFTFELRASSVLTSAGFPFAAAPWSAVPTGPLETAVASAPCASSRLTTSASFTEAEAMRGVMPTASAALTLAPFASSWRTTSTVPCPEAATMSGVRPSWVTALTSAPASRSQRVLRESRVARCRAVTPPGPTARTSALLSSRMRRLSRLPNAAASIRGVCPCASFVSTPRSRTNVRSVARSFSRMTR